MFVFQITVQGKASQKIPSFGTEPREIDLREALAIANTLEPKGAEASLKRFARDNPDARFTARTDGVNVVVEATVPGKELQEGWVKKRKIFPQEPGEDGRYRIIGFGGYTIKDYVEDVMLKPISELVSSGAKVEWAELYFHCSAQEIDEDELRKSVVAALAHITAGASSYIYKYLGGSWNIGYATYKDPKQTEPVEIGIYHISSRAKDIGLYTLSDFRGNVSEKDAWFVIGNFTPCSGGRMTLEEANAVFGYIRDNAAYKYELWSNKRLNYLLAHPTPENLEAIYSEFFKEDIYELRLPHLDREYCGKNPPLGVRAIEGIFGKYYRYANIGYSVKEIIRESDRRSAFVFRLPMDAGEKPPVQLSDEIRFAGSKERKTPPEPQLPPELWMSEVKVAPAAEKKVLGKPKDGKPEKQLELQRTEVPRERHEVVERPEIRMEPFELPREPMKQPEPARLEKKELPYLKQVPPPPTLEKKDALQPVEQPVEFKEKPPEEELPKIRPIKVKPKKEAPENPFIKEKKTEQADSTKMGPAVWMAAPEEEQPDSNSLKPNRKKK